jgi:hypothetical protein
MARSQYIYLIRYLAPGHPAHLELLAAFTVKHEAIEWALLCPHHLPHLQLSRTRDGMTYHKAEDVIPWPAEALLRSSLDTRKLEPNDYRQECQGEFPGPARGTEVSQANAKTKAFRY